MSLSHCSLKNLTKLQKHATRLPFQKHSLCFLEFPFIKSDYVICMRYPRVCATLSETTQVQKWLCVAILAFLFFPFPPRAIPVSQSHDFSPHSPLISWSQTGQGGNFHLCRVLLRRGITQASSSCVLSSAGRGLTEASSVGRLLASESLSSGSEFK